VTTQAMISVYDYFGSERDKSDGVFNIVPLGAGIQSGRVAKQVLSSRIEYRRGLGILLSGLMPKIPGTVDLISLEGKRAAHWSFVGPSSESGRVILGQDALPRRGVYRAVLRQGNRQMNRLLVFDRVAD